jgi:DNA adenine methylase
MTKILHNAIDAERREAPTSKVSQTSIQPLLKWPGGKRGLWESIMPFFPREYGRYWEPFVGGGAVFFSLNPATASLSDKNEGLIETYSVVRDEPEKLIQKLQRMKNSEDEYYRIRAKRPDDRVARAARFIYLCTLAFNGIHRYNLRGEFNVPYGFKTHLDVCDSQRILDCSARLNSKTLRHGDFEAILVRAKEGDLVYLDPPYTVAHNNNGFVKYNASIFSWQDQKRLAESAKAARRRGCYVVVSNADHSCVKDLYKGFNSETIKRYSIMASKSEFRKPITESLFWSHPK